MATTTKNKRKFKTTKVNEDKFILKLIELMNNLTDEKWEVFYKEIKFESPVNAFTNKSYRGANIILLLLDMIDKKFLLNGYLTFNQIKELKGVLKKGSQGMPIEFFTPIYKHKENDNTIFENEYLKLSDETKKEYSRKSILKQYYVFNISQIENYDEFKINLLAQVENKFSNTVELDNNYQNIIDNLIQNKGLVIEQILQGKAYYRPSYDKVFLPKIELFKSTKEYYSTLFHELIHWTGSKDRLNRSLQGMNDRENYAFEELIAEIGSLIINLNNGQLEDFKNSIVYLKGWLKHTKNADINQEETLRKAFIEAQKAVSFLIY